MTALEQIMQSAQEINCACGTPMVAGNDAIGRVRHRCPVRDGVAPPRRRSPDDIALMPQGLVRIAALPPIQPGQLRCQVCAKGVDGDARFCASCEAARTEDERSRQRRLAAEHRCLRCMEVIPPKTGRPQKICDGCLTPAELAEREYKRNWKPKSQRPSTSPTLLEELA